MCRKSTYFILFCIFLKAYLQQDWIGSQLLSYAFNGKSEAEKEMKDSFQLNSEKSKKKKLEYGQTVWSLTLLQAYPSYSGNKHREHGASPLVSTRSESEPVGIFKATEAGVFRLHAII